MSTDQDEIKKLKIDIFSSDWDKIKTSVSRLFEIGHQENFDYLIKLLNESNPLVRNAAAITFMNNKFNDALEPLINSITKEENKNSRGTMVYALQGLDCDKKLKELFDILFTAPKNWEVQSGILTVLEEQEFEFAKDDLIEIKEKWERLKDDWNALNGIDEANPREYEINREIIQDLVDGYLYYLKNN